MSLLDTYNKMREADVEQSKTAELEKEAAQLQTARVEVLAKYAEAADKVLSTEYGDDYEEADVQKLASYLIDRDVEEEEQSEKVAEYVEAGQIMARSFIEELNSEQS